MQHHHAHRRTRRDGKQRGNPGNVVTLQPRALSTKSRAGSCGTWPQRTRSSTLACDTSPRQCRKMVRGGGSRSWRRIEHARSWEKLSACWITRHVAKMQSHASWGQPRSQRGRTSAWIKCSKYELAGWLGFPPFPKRPPSSPAPVTSWEAAAAPVFIAALCNC